MLRTAVRRFAAVVSPVLCLALVACTGTQRRGYETIAAPLRDDPMQVHRYRLDNGLTVYLSRNTQEPRFYSEIAIRAGSKADPADATGLAHYLEHLLFKGSKNLGTLDYAKEAPHLARIEELYEQHFHEADPAKRAEIYRLIGQESALAARFAVPNELDKTYSAMGSSLMNAHTWLEEVVYKIELPSNRLGHWGRIEADRFEYPVFRVFQPELEIVYEEKNRWMDNPEAILMESVMAARYSQHPYGSQTTIGTAEHLKRPSLRKIREYYDTWYVPNNMGIFISGDIEPKEAIRTIAGEFGRLKAKPLPEPKTWPTDTVRGRQVVELKYPGEEKVLMAFPTVGHGHPDEEALMLADMILSNRAAGLIDLNLNQAQRVREAGAYPQINNDAGSQFLYAIPKAGQSVEEAEKLLLEQLDLLRKGEFPDWLLEAIITDFRKSRKAELEENTARVRTMRESFIAREEWDRTVRLIDRMEKVTREDVIRVARQYYGDNYVVGFRRDGQHTFDKMEKPQIDKLALDPSRQSDFARAILAEPVAPIEPVYLREGRDYQIVREDNGRTFYYAHNPLNDLFTLTITAQRGQDADRTLPLAVQLLDKAGTKTFHAEELKEQWYRLGSDFSTSSGDADTAFTISGLDENLEETLTLATELLDAPVVAPGVLETLKTDYLGAREDRRKEPRSMMAALEAFSLYGAESPWLEDLPGERVKSLTEQELMEALRRVRGTKHAVMYTGSLPLDKVRAIVNRVDPVDGDLAEPTPLRLRKLRQIPQTEILFVHAETAQTQVSLDVPGSSFDPASIAASQVFNDAFGFIVYQRLREARALAYSAFGRYLLTDRVGGQNYTAGDIGTQVDKTIDATQGFMALLQEMPVADEEFENSRKTVENLYRTSRIDYRGIIPTVRRWERLGITEDPRPARFEVLRNAKPELVKEFHAREIKGRPLLISIVGDKNRIDRKELEKLAPVRDVTVDEIFPK